MAGHSTTPVIWVAPVRSHCIPIITSFCCAAAVPASITAAAALNTSADILPDRFVISGLSFLPPLVCCDKAEAYRQSRKCRCWRVELFGLLYRLGDHLRISVDPVGLLDELAALDLVDLHPAAP